jgi:heptosyltransferase I
MQWLFVRTDKIGDLVCSLGVDQIPELISNNQTSTSASITWLVSDKHRPIFDAAEIGRRAIFVDFERPIRAFFQILSQAKKFDGVCVLYARWWQALALFLAGIPQRVGRRSQWFSFLFYNRSLRQKRSQSERHESEYSLDLVLLALNSRANPVTPPLFRLSKVKLTPIWNHLLSTENKNSLSLIENQFCVVHPGMAGSAKNWSCENYSSLIHHLSKKQTVVITGTAIDQLWISKIRELAPPSQNIVYLDCQLNLSELMAVLSRSLFCVGPSTGVMHLASSLDLPILCLFSPIRAQSPRRWSPRGQRVQVLTPRVDDCPAAKICIGSKCKHFDCMDLLRIDDVLNSLNSNKFTN